MNKSVICAWGCCSYGKSSVVNCVYIELKSKGALDVPGMQYNGYSLPYHRNNNSEILAMVDYRGKKIGIESQNNNGGLQFQTIPFLVNQGCDIIVCASQSQGNTRYNVERLSKNFDVFWMSPFYYATTNQNAATRHSKINYQSVISIVNFIDELINGTI